MLCERRTGRGSARSPTFGERVRGRRAAARLDPHRRVQDNPQNDPAGVADYGYETPNVDRFRGFHAADPRDVAADDPRWVAVRSEPQTVFLRQVRELTRGRPRPTPVAALVGHPRHYRGLQDPIAGNRAGLLLDVPAWADEGLVDAVVAAGYCRPGGTPEAAFAALREETRGKTDVWAFAWVQRTPEEFGRDLASASSLGAGRMPLWAADYLGDRPNTEELKAAMNRRAP